MRRRMSLMAESETDSASFWLPSEFLTDDDFLIGVQESSKPYKAAAPRPNLNRFPHITNGGLFVDTFGSSLALNSPGESVTSSAEAEENDDRDDFLSEWTRHLARSTVVDRAAQKLQSQEKSWGVLATSPQSTLSGYASWSSRSNGSPKATSFGCPQPSPAPALYDAKEEALELIYAAAGQVARMKMKAEAEAQMLSRQQQQQSRGLLGPPCNLSSPSPGRSPVCFNFSQAPQHINNQDKEGWFSQQQLQLSRGNAGRMELFEKGRCSGNGNGFGVPLIAWSAVRAQPHSHHNHHGPLLHQVPSSDCVGGGGSGMRAVFLGGSGSCGPKRQSSGTGVFLPRRFGNNSATFEPRKKQGCSTVLLPTRVVQALNLNLEVNGRYHPQIQPCLVSNHDILVAARRNALLAQQRRSSRPEEVAITDHEVLPHDWTY